MNDVNEFENIETAEGSSSNQEELINSGMAGTAYDWNKAPEGVKAPPRVSLDGQTVTIKKADIILPPMGRSWEKSRDGKTEYKTCTFVLFYDKEGQQEFYSGVRVFNRDGKYSHPTIMRDRQNQSSRLLGLYADFKKKEIQEVSLREFMSFLNSTPKAKIQIESVTNPHTKETINKNIVLEFVE
jgi:hypothetical protein